MRQMWVRMLVILALVNEWCHCCLDEERIGLLEIKVWLNDPKVWINDPNLNAYLTDWVDNKKDADCCKWHGVKCDSTTKRVVELSLEDTNYYWGFDLGLYLNASLFLPFIELKSLNLKGNGLRCCFKNQGFEILSSKLRKLEILNLDSNQFNDSIVLSLSQLSSLKSLNLADNLLTGSASINGFEVLASGLRKLEELDLSGNTFSNNILSFLHELSSLKILDLSHNNLTTISSGINGLRELEELYLRGNLLNDNVSVSLRGLSALKILDLSDNMNLTGSMGISGWCELKNLQQLSLSFNKLEGLLPSCLRNLSSLQLLDVSHNQLVGNIGSSVLTNLTSLKYLDLSSNHFEVPNSFKSFVNHSNLGFLSCGDNKLIAETFIQSIVPKFQLKFFIFSNCTSKLGEIPKFLHNQHDLRVIDLSYNKIRGMFPSWLFENNTRLEHLLLRDNFFRGPLQFQYHPNPHLLSIDITNNNIDGQIPRNMCLTFPNVIYLKMAKNGLEGDAPTCFANMSALDFLDLSNNELSTIKLEQLTSLTFLKVSNNNLEGHISPSVFNSSNWRCLYLDGNNLTGQAWDISSLNLFYWIALDISNNHFSGMLPKWIGNMSNILAIDLSKNHFKGPIPREFCNLSSLEYFDLSENGLFGSIPSCFSPSGITHIHLSKNQLSGPLTSSFLNISTLVTLDLSNNNFNGPIPNSIRDLSSLSVLLLKANHFDGELPIELCMLRQLSILDVSKNKLSGHLPSCFSNLTFKEASEKEYHGRVFIQYPLYVKSNFESMGLPNLRDLYDTDRNPAIIFEELVEFTTKRYSYSYEGGILNFMSGIDLSCNRFSGDIPSELGKLDGLRALNLSHNNFIGSLPTTFSKLNQIESLDLSHNSLTGIIPPQLIAITTLAVFSVAYNNLSGTTPEMKNQFGTFDESSYEGNPLLCGPPLQTSCTREESPSQSMPNDDEEDDDFVDMDDFVVSFVVCYVIVVLTIALVLYINPYWRRRWFYFIEECIDTCYYFVVDSFHKLSSFGRS